MANCEVRRCGFGFNVTQAGNGIASRDSPMPSSAPCNEPKESIVKKAVWMLLLAIAPVVGFCATPAQEKAFVDAYKKALEAKDEKTLTGFLYTKGADPQALEFYKMMMTSDMGGKITSIQLVDLDASDKKRAEGGPGPNGKPMKFTLHPTKKLVIKSETKDANGSSSSSSEVFVAESDGKIVIPAPGPAN
jgi:hypothetical protein